MNNESLLNFLDGLGKGSQVINLTYSTAESKSRTKKGKKVLNKVVCRNAYLNHDYSKKVNDRVGGGFVAEKASGRKGTERKFITESDKVAGKLYLTLHTHKNDFVKTDYFLAENGESIDLSTKELKLASGLFMPSYFEPKTTAGRGRVAENDDFNHFATCLDNILQVKAKGKVWNR